MSLSSVSFYAFFAPRNQSGSVELEDFVKFLDTNMTHVSQVNVLPVYLNSTRHALEREDQGLEETAKAGIRSRSISIILICQWGSYSLHRLMHMLHKTPLMPHRPPWITIKGRSSE